MNKFIILIFLMFNQKCALQYINIVKYYNNLKELFYFNTL